MKLITQQPCINSAEYIPPINTEAWGVEQIMQVYTVEKAQRPSTNPQACLSFLKKNARSLTGKEGSQSQSQMAFLVMKGNTEVGWQGEHRPLSYPCQ